MDPTLRKAVDTRDARRYRFKRSLSDRQGAVLTSGYSFFSGFDALPAAMR